MMKNFYLKNEDVKSSRQLQGKRRLANYDGCAHDLKEILPLLFDVFETSKIAMDERLSPFKPENRTANLEASIFQSCFAEELFAKFKFKASYGKFSRIILRSNGYLFLFKKLSDKSKPVGTKTKNVQNIYNQKQTANLFALDGSDYEDEPILFFGYKKNELNQIVEPQIVYLDEGKVIFTYFPSQSTTQLTIKLDENKPKIENQNVPKIRKKA